MADSHPKNLDPRPKRWRDEDSPYEIYTAGINTAHPRFYLFFKDGGGVKRWMEIDKALFEATLNRRAAKPQSALDNHRPIPDQSAITRFLSLSRYPCPYGQ